MSTSLIGRVLRPVTLLVAGMLLGQALLSVTTSPTSAATIRTRVASCAGLDFHPVDDRTQYRSAPGMIYRRTGEGDGVFVCDPHLPHRAVVTRVRFTVQDLSPEVSVQHCALRRFSLGTASADTQRLGEVSATGFTPVPGIVRRSDTSISRATIDNTAYGYWLSCQIWWTDAITSTTVPLGAIIGADVTYKISSTHG